MNRPPPRSALFPYATIFRRRGACGRRTNHEGDDRAGASLEAGDWRASRLCRSREFRAVGIAGMRANRQLPAKRRSEEHTSELQSHLNLVCRLLLEKKKNKIK